MIIRNLVSLCEVVVKVGRDEISKCTSAMGPAGRIRITNRIPNLPGAFVVGVSMCVRDFGEHHEIARYQLLPGGKSTLIRNVECYRKLGLAGCGVSEANAIVCPTATCLVQAHSPVTASRRICTCTGPTCLHVFYCPSARRHTKYPYDPGQSPPTNSGGTVLAPAGHQP